MIKRRGFLQLLAAAPVLACLSSTIPKLPKRRVVIMGADPAYKATGFAGEVTCFVITNGGSGYTSCPAAAFTSERLK